MKELKFRLTGICPLLMHDNKSSNPFNQYAQYLKPLTANRTKSDSDFSEIARVEWEAGLYLEKGMVVLPGRNLDGCFFEASKKSKLGIVYKQTCMVTEDYYFLKYKGPFIKVKQNGDIPIQELDQFYEYYRSQEMVKVQKGRILRTRPIFYDWSLEAAIYFDEGLNERTLVNTLHLAGEKIGLCEKRPRLGRFTVEII